MGKKKTNRCYLTATEIKKFRTILLAKRKEILGDVICMEDETLRKQRSDLSDLPFHMADAGTDNYEMENTLGLMDSERKLIEQIDDALERIQDGTYGVCDGIGEPIPVERLQAIPWARYCVACARLLEKGLFNREEPVRNSRYDYEAGGVESEDPERFYQGIERP